MTTRSHLTPGGVSAGALIHTVMRRDVGPSVPLPLSAAIGAHKDDYYQALRPYQTYIGDAGASERSQAACAAIDYVADAVAVACHYGQVVAVVVSGMERSWANLGLRPHSAATAVLDCMSTMPAATATYLAETTGQSPRAIRRAVASLVDLGALTETTDKDSGRRVFELPEMLRVVDERNDLLLDCWDLRTSGTEEVLPELLERYHSGAMTGQQKPTERPGSGDNQPQPRAPQHCGASTTSGGIIGGGWYNNGTG